MEYTIKNIDPEIWLNCSVSDVQYLFTAVTFYTQNSQFGSQATTDRLYRLQGALGSLLEEL